MLTLTQFQPDPDTKQSVKHLPVQWQYNNVKTTFQRPCFPILLCWLWTRKHLHWKNARNARYPTTHTSFNCSKTLKKCEKKFLKIVFLTLKSCFEQEHFFWLTNNLLFCTPLGLCTIIKKLITLTLKRQ